MTSSHGSYVSSLKRHRWTFFSIFFFLYGVVWAYGHARSTHRNPETLKSQSLSHLSSLPLHHCSLSSLPLSLVAIGYHSLLTQSLSTFLSLCLVAIGHHELPRQQLAHLITLCLSLTLPSRHRLPRATQITAHSLNHSLPLSHSASSSSLQVSLSAILQLQLISALLLQGTLSFLILLSFMSIYIFWPIYFVK